MTISRNVDLSRYNDRYSKFEDVMLAPEGCHEHAKAIARLIDETVHGFHQEARALKLNAPNCDQIREVEVALYRYIADANPLDVASAEGYGEHRSPAVDAGLERDRDFLTGMATAQRTEEQEADELREIIEDLLADSDGGKA